MPQKPFIIPEDEIEITAMRSQGAGGQNVNKVESAVHLRYDISASSLSEGHKLRLLALKDHRINGDGIIVIKAQNHRTQEMNRQEAIRRLYEMVLATAKPPKTRKPTRPTLASKKRRLEGKQRHGQTKALRGKVLE